MPMEEASGSELELKRRRRATGAIQRAEIIEFDCLMNFLRGPQEDDEGDISREGKSHTDERPIHFFFISTKFFCLSLSVLKKRTFLRLKCA